MIIDKKRSDLGPKGGVVRSGPQIGCSRGIRGKLLVASIAVALVTAPAIGWAEEGRGETTGREGGLGAAAAISSLVYAPVKLLYAVGGLVIGGFAWGLTAGDTEVASTIFTRSVRGTYVITPEILTGEQPLEFIGSAVDEPANRSETIAAAPPVSDPPAVYEDSGYDDMGW